MSNKVILYGNHLSQPSRAVYWYLLLNDIPFEFKLIRIDKREQKDPSYLKINPNGKIPTIIDDGFIVFESHAILRYLHQKYGKEDFWYPKDLILQTKINQYLDWHHSNLRKCSQFLFAKLFAKMRGVQVSQRFAERSEEEAKEAIKQLNDYWLKDGKYVAGLEKPSIADLSAYSELEELCLIDYNLSGYKNIIEWRKKMESLPWHEKVHKVLYSMKRKSKL